MMTQSIQHINPLKVVAKVILSITFTLFAASTAMAQSNPDEVNLSTFTNQSVEFDVNSSQQPLPLNVNHCSIALISGSGGSFTLEATPDLDFTGTADFRIRYYKSIPFPPFLREEYTQFYLTVANGMIATNDDFILLDTASTYTVFPLINDTSSAPGLKIQDIAQVQNGSVTSIDSSSFEYTVLSPDVELEKIIYISKDDIGTHGSGTVYLAREESNPTASGELSFIISNTESQVIKLPSFGFTQVGSANYGSLSNELNGMVWIYTPSINNEAIDSLSFVDGNGLSRTVILDIRDYANLELAMDDKIFTAVNSAITFDAFENDNFTGNIILDWHSTELVHDSAGIFTYTPPVDYEGIKTFSYILDNGFGLHEAIVEINVGNREPRTDINYTFSTPKNKSLVLNYQVELADYSMAVVNSPSFGFAEAFDENTVVTVDCEDVTGKAFVIYTPDVGFTGIDSMSVTYCTPNGQCNQYEIEIEVYENNEADCIRCHTDCVWEGDTNKDGRVSVRDIIPIAKAMGSGGEVRTDVDYGRWESQSVADWDNTLVNGINYKHIDTDGDGFITEADVDAVDSRYNDIHQFVPRDVLAFKEYPLYFVPHTTVVDSGDLLVLDIMLGIPGFEVENLNGFAFGVNINSGFVDSASMELTFFEDSWLAGNGNIVQMAQTPKDGRFEAAVAKSNGNNANGYGIIGQLSFIVEDEAEGIRENIYSSTRQIKIFTEEVVLDDRFGNSFKLDDNQANVTLNINRKRSALSNDDVLLYPSPASDNINVHLNGGRLFSKVEVFNVLGNRVSSLSVVESNHENIDISSFNTGIYIVQLQTSEGVVSKKFVKK